MNLLSMVFPASCIRTKAVISKLYSEASHGSLWNHQITHISLPPPTWWHGGTLELLTFTNAACICRNPVRLGDLSSLDIVCFLYRHLTLWVNVWKATTKTTISTRYYLWSNLTFPSAAFKAVTALWSCRNINTSYHQQQLYNQHAQPRSFKVGDHVWLDSPKTEKLNPKWEGRWVTGTNKQVTVKLQLRGASVTGLTMLYLFVLYRTDLFDVN